MMPVSSVTNLEELTRHGLTLTLPQDRDGLSVKRDSGVLHWRRELLTLILSKDSTRWSLAKRVSTTPLPTRFLSQTVWLVLLVRPVTKRAWV